MKWLNGNRISLLLVGFVAAVVVGGGSAKADFTFGEPTNLDAPINSPSLDASPFISSDGLQLYFCSDREGGIGKTDLWMVTRSTKDDEWGPPVNLGTPINSPESESAPCISADGLTLYFASRRPGGSGNLDIWVTTSATVNDPWAEPVNLGPLINSSFIDSGPSLSPDGLSLFFYSYKPGGSGNFDIWVTTRSTDSDPWGTSMNLGSTVNSSYADGVPSISADGLMLFFYSDRPAGYGGGDLWVTTRASNSDPWRTPVNLGSPVNSSTVDSCPNISTDGLTLYFLSDRPGGQGSFDLWQVPIIPFVDFNGDGIVDIDDLVILIEHWGQDEPSVDIGPMPWGDGIVDVQDLDVLMSYWGQEFEFLPFDLLAYWKLDEAEGVIAYDSAGDNDGTLYGEPLWQPTAGAVDGALAFDGTDDYVSTPFVLNPADTKFSVFAWVKGAAPGQVIISQTGGTNWLLADPSEGKLMTKLIPPAIGLRVPPKPLVSEFVITDGDWHRIGFVWDGSQRMLYVDDVEVAKDTQSGLETSEGGLYIGAGSTLEPGGFFSGLIDDVRIYNRAITP